MTSHSRLVFLVPVVLLVVTACSGGGASPSAATPPPAESPAVSPASPGPTGGLASPDATRIEVELQDTMRIVPDPIEVPAGVPVTFVVHNSGTVEHEFVIGDEEIQAEHEAEMAGGGMGHDEPNAILVDPGQTRELTWTFEAAGETLAGCHVPGHYPAGMKATIRVTG
ncbi:MAG TPA: plastocyanin/azurin family copper-binding protein [Clostridia bacterium]|nr:plastocyanin/azurin family copper-binding protein [Clostridia bacterium]